MAQLEQLRRRRGAYRGKITQIRNQLDAEQETVNFGRIQSMLSSISRAREGYETTQASIEELDPTEIDNAAVNEFETEYVALEGQLLQLAEERKVVSGSSRTKPKLPDITVPKFDGDVTNWINFRDSFEELVIRRDLDSVAKFRYLETSLQGSSAYNLIKNKSSTEFLTAWQTLLDEFNNVTAIKEQHVKSIYDVRIPIENCAKSLQSFLDTVDTNLAALRSLEIPVDEWDLLLVYHLSSRLYPALRRELEKDKRPNEILTYVQFKEFIKKHISILQRCGPIPFRTPLASSTPKSKPFQSNQNPLQRVKSFASNTSNNVTSSIVCYICGDGHSAFKCPQFEPLSYEERKQKVNSLKICINCLQSGHNVSNCESRNCRICREKHHTLLHPPRALEKSENEKPKESVNHSIVKKQVVLATAIILICNRQGQFTVCRAFLDGGSTANFITETLVQKLKLEKNPVYTSVVGVNNTKSYNNYQVTTTVKSCHSQYSADLDFLISRRITDSLPLQKVDISNFKIPEDIKLADPSFFEPQKIDILLGAETFYEVFTGTKTEIAPKLWICETKFGHIIVGKETSFDQKQEIVFSAIEDLKIQIQKFWELENPLSETNFTLEEKAAEAHYVRSVERTECGRYTVGLPFNERVSSLGISKDKAKALFLLSENRLQKRLEKYEHYKEFIQEMIDLDHIELASEEEDEENYITHHMVTRLSSTTTKYRVVFNGSFKSSSGISLNDTLLIGPVIQDDLFSHQIRWREKSIAVTGDLMKMYRQILHHREDRKFLKIWWRFSPQDQLKSYQLKTITYGTSSAPFQAIRTLKQLAIDEVANHPIGSKLLESNFYVDDLVSSFDSQEQALLSIEDLTSVASKGGFKLHKFASNCSSLNQSEDLVTVLGINWFLPEDKIIIELGNLSYHTEITKASVLSEIAQIYDPLGLTSPVILKAKCFMQILWTEQHLSWDTPLPENLKKLWIEFQESLKNMGKISIPRCCIQSSTNFQLHGFCDASKIGYGACIYVHVPGQLTYLLCAKSRVAPLKLVTIPRLELCAAVLLSRLIKKVKKSLTVQPIKTVLWTDSMVTRYRIQNPSNQYKTFVGTRLSEIQESTDPLDWRFVPTSDNPADVVSRGLLPTEMESCHIWWNGPQFLQNPDIQWPEDPKHFEKIDDELQIKKPEIVFVAVNNICDDVINRYSCLEKLIKVIATCSRFLHNCKNLKEKRITGTINATERKLALNKIVIICQSVCLQNEIQCLTKNQVVEKSSKIYKLNPFIDLEGVVRVGGRLENSKLSEDHQHQIIIPGYHQLAKLITIDVHNKNMHCGPQALLNTIRQQFWITNGRRLCKKIVHSCVPCFRHKPIMLQQIMGQLPVNRLSPSRAFDVVGIDYFGYIKIKYEIRTKVQTKAWVCVFTCFHSRATHLELVHDYSAGSFIGALRRFISRRGIPTHIYCDNATNFTGGRNELEELHKIFFDELQQNQLLEFCATNRIIWHFQPARSPHFNGMQESIVRQAKTYFYHAIKDTIYTTEQINTLLCQVESCLNSRPITPLNDDINDLKALTPGHFLIFQPLNTLPDPSLQQFKENRLDVWQKIQCQLQKFWQRWSNDYLNELQLRNKWFEVKPNIKIGTMVILHMDNTPPMTWPIGRITEVYPGKDGFVRVVKVKTMTGEYQRAINKISPLPIYDD